MNTSIKDILAQKGKIYASSQPVILNVANEKELVGKGKMPPSALKSFDGLSKAKKIYSEKKLEKLEKNEVERTKKDALELIGNLMEYSQRGKLSELEKVRFHINVDNREGELYLLGDKAFLISDIKQPEISLIDLEKGNLSKATAEQLSEAQKKPSKVKLNASTLSRIEKVIGKKIEIVF